MVSEYDLIDDLNNEKYEFIAFLGHVRDLQGRDMVRALIREKENAGKNIPSK